MTTLTMQGNIRRDLSRDNACKNNSRNCPDARCPARYRRNGKPPS